MTKVKNFKVILVSIFLFIFSSITSFQFQTTYAWNSDEVGYPLKKISKLDCRFTEFDDLSSSCKQNLPILKTDDYEKYSIKDGWYNDYTRLYTVLWWASYEYGWDVWYGWHMWVDIATSKWTPIYSIAEWTVIEAEYNSGHWNYVSISHTINWKKIVSNYAHMSKILAEVWDKVSKWTQIWEVWSTWNSTGNHLHFQIDIDTTSSPAYYNYNSCPYSYYQITEEGVCFEELEELTVDPLLFLETEGAILDSYTTTEKVSSYESSSSSVDTDIFDTTVYVWYSSWDIREVQQIYSALWYYNWSINWDYEDVLDSVIDFQIENWIIENKYSTWAWWFGPKTRSVTEVIYKQYLADWGEETKVYITSKDDDDDTETIKISKSSLLSREEIEAKEVENFLDDYNIELDFSSAWTNVAINDTETLKLSITDKKWKAFKGNMPSWMTFIVNTEKATVFPERLYYFTNWKRDILVTWVSAWTTTLYVKVWTVTVKTFSLKVYDSNQTIYPEDAQIYAPSTVTIWDTWTAVAVFKDSSNQSIINLEYWSTYTLKASEGNSVCIKSWSISQMNTIYKSSCDNDEYSNQISFDYSDTVGWILIYDYKANSRDVNFSISNNYNSSELAYDKILVSDPKWLTSSYDYSEEVLSMLEEWIVDWINQWYFLEDRDLDEESAYNWIANSLVKYKENTISQSTLTKIENNIKTVAEKQKKASKYTELSRLEFLELVYDYLIFDSNIEITRTYKDLEDSENKVVNSVFNSAVTWKDQFWESYFQSDNNITRWESAYILSIVFEDNSDKYLTLY